MKRRNRVSPGSGARRYTQAELVRIYRVWARIYGGTSYAYTFGQLPRLRRMAVDALQLHPGASVLDVSCGTGANFRLIQERIGPTGRLVGIDYSPHMLAQAQRLVTRKGWRNVQLVEADAAALELGEQFDAVLWSLAASVVPDWQAALERAIAHAKPESRLVVADGRFSERWYGRPFNWLADMMNASGGADAGRRPWELLPRWLADVGYHDLFMGFLYVAWGRKPAVEGPVGEGPAVA